RKLLDQLIYQFAPSWGYELSIDRNKEIIDMSLSTQLLAHHGAAKLFNNNLNYHMPKEVADISMFISLTMLIVSIILSWSSIAIGVLATTFAASIFMKVCVMHNREMALKPYSIYDRLGLMESIEQVRSIWVKYDNEESIIMIKMLENFELLNDTESLHSYDGQFSKRINQIDLVKLAEFEESMKIEASSQTSVANRVISVFSKQPTILSKKLFLKQIDMRSNIALSSAALENAQKLFDHIKEEAPSGIKENKQMRQLLVSFLHKEHPNFSQKRLVALSEFIFEGNQDSFSFKAKDPLEGFAVDDVAKFLSNMQAIKKVKAQLEDFSKHDQAFPTYYELKRISDIHVEDVRLMEKKGVTCFSDLEKLIDPYDFTGKSLYSCEHNNAVRDVISDYMKSSGDNIRMTSKIKPMSMFGCIKIEDKDDEEDQLQSSFSIGVAEVPLST
ncbi:MAG: hypothetical protein P8L77_02920, partial [Gammaproteobacteria bacterium]|nr:hypothetical protein [Gammaproteobacteria bacterium]